MKLFFLEDGAILPKDEVVFRKDEAVFRA